MRRARDRSTTSSGPALLAGALCATLLAMASCGGSDTQLSEEAARGRDIARAKGCAGCHGQDGEGGIGPTWVGLAGSEVNLYDGSTIVADDAYLVRSIKDPAADLLADFAIQMPQNELNDSEVDAIVAYIKELGPPLDKVSAVVNE